MDSLHALRNLSGMMGFGSQSPTSSDIAKGTDAVSLAWILKTLFLASAVYFVLSCVHSRYFHPLSKFPGPFWASVSNFWKLYIAITKESHTRGLEYHKKYGKSYS